MLGRSRLAIGILLIAGFVLLTFANSRIGDVARIEAAPSVVAMRSHVDDPCHAPAQKGCSSPLPEGRSAAHLSH
jgi:hypothetical protein